jgi:hypothetical protein
MTGYGTRGNLGIQGESVNQPLMQMEKDSSFSPVLPSIKELPKKKFAYFQRLL